MHPGDREYYLKRRDEWLARARAAMHRRTAEEYEYMANRYDRLAKFKDAVG